MKFGKANRQFDISEGDRLSDEMITSLQEKFSEIKDISYEETVGSGTVKSGANSANINVSGINTGYYEANDMTLLAGRNISEADVKGNKSVIVVSDKVVEYAFDGDSSAALNQKINVDVNGVYYTFYIVGIYEYEDNGVFSSDSDEEITTSAYIPITTGKEKFHTDKGYEQVTVVTSAQVENVADLATEIEDFFNNDFYKTNEKYEVSTTTMSTMTDSMNEMIQTVSIAIAFIAGISLLVGGIGVMNIMLVSITERTREIGTRKALGAKNSSIRLQFITESVILCLVGGIFGIMLGFGLGATAASVMGYGAAVPIAAILIAVAFSMIIGVFFGYYPANKAAKLNPIEALRYE